MAHTLSVPVVLGAGSTGLTLAAQGVNPDGSNAAGFTTTNLVELVAGSGTYGWTGTVPDGFNGFIKFSTSPGGLFKAAAGLNPQESENSDQRTSLVGTEISEMHGLLGQNSGLRNPVYTAGNLTSYDLNVYDSAAHAIVNDGVTGLLHKYSVSNTYDAAQNLLTSVMTRIS